MSKAKKWISRGEKVIFKNYGRYPIVPQRGQGCRLWDVDGNVYLDFLAGVAVNNLGHCHPNVVAALQKQAGEILHCSNFYHIPKQIELAELLCQHSFGDRVFFCNSGAEANEAALKLVRKYSRDKYGENRHEIITALASFHGRTIGTLSATGQEKIRTGFSPFVPGFRYIPFGDIDALRDAIGPGTCAVMLEPVQGEGGVNLPPPGYFQEVRKVCDKNNILLVLDEVQSGCGRTGKLFAHEHEGMAPDIMTLAKGLAGGPPIGALVATDRIAEAFLPGSHGSTFGGNPLMCAAAVASIKTLLEEDVLENCRKMGEYLWGRLEGLKSKHSFIRGIRGRGLLIGMDLDTPGADIVHQAMEKGLLINCTAGTVLRFVPPLIVTREEIDQALDILDSILKKQ